MSVQRAFLRLCLDWYSVVESTDGVDNVGQRANSSQLAVKRRRSAENSEPGQIHLSRVGSGLGCRRLQAILLLSCQTLPRQLARRPAATRTNRHGLAMSQRQKHAPLLSPHTLSGVFHGFMRHLSSPNHKTFSALAVVPVMTTQR